MKLNLENLQFNSKASNIMHIDINSCFATIEQQANPLIRNRPVVVAAYNSNNGCILASSVDAKKLGIKTGMHVRNGKYICPNLIVLEPDPIKYRHIHKKLKELLLEYTPDVIPKSIDEFVLNLENTPSQKIGIIRTSLEIKKRIKEEIGDYITVSIGISTNKILAKIASNLKKPDGLSEINSKNHLYIYNHLKLTDLTGINVRNELRLNSSNIYTVMDLYDASAIKLQQAFKSKIGFYWYLNLRGYEINESFNETAIQKSYGHSYSLYKPLNKFEDISPILQKLVIKMGKRLRNAKMAAKGVHLYIRYKDGFSWHKGIKLSNAIFNSKDLYKEIEKIFKTSPFKNLFVRLLAVSCFDLMSENSLQLELFSDITKQKTIVKTIDNINNKFGDFTVIPAGMITAKDKIRDSISFGKTKELNTNT